MSQILDGAVEPAGAAAGGADYLTGGPSSDTEGHRDSGGPRIAAAAQPYLPPQHPDFYQYPQDPTFYGPPGLGQPGLSPLGHPQHPPQPHPYPHGTQAYGPHYAQGYGAAYLWQPQQQGHPGMYGGPPLERFSSMQSWASGKSVGYNPGERAALVSSMITASSSGPDSKKCDPGSLHGAPSAPHTPTHHAKGDRACASVLVSPSTSTTHAS